MGKWVIWDGNLKMEGVKKCESIHVSNHMCFSSWCKQRCHLVSLASTFFEKHYLLKSHYKSVDSRLWRLVGELIPFPRDVLATPAGSPG